MSQPIQLLSEALSNVSGSGGTGGTGSGSGSSPEIIQIQGTVAESSSAVEMYYYDYGNGLGRFTLTCQYPTTVLTSDRTQANITVSSHHFQKDRYWPCIAIYGGKAYAAMFQTDTTYDNWIHIIFNSRFDTDRTLKMEVSMVFDVADFPAPTQDK